MSSRRWSWSPARRAASAARSPSASRATGRRSRCSRAAATGLDDDRRGGRAARRPGAAAADGRRRRGRGRSGRRGDRGGARRDRYLDQQRDDDRVRVLRGRRARTSSGARPRSPTSARSGGRRPRSSGCVPRDRGTIVQVGSALAYRGIPLQSPYCGSKHALKGFFESVRTELLHDGSNVHMTMVQLPGPEHAPVRPLPLEDAEAADAGAADLPAGGRGRRRSTSPPTRGGAQVYVGGSTVYTILGNKIAPWLADRYLARTGVEGQQTSEPVDGRATATCSSRSTSDPGAHGDFDAQAHSRSLQALATRHRTTVLGSACRGVRPPRCSALRSRRDRAVELEVRGGGRVPRQRLARRPGACARRFERRRVAQQLADGRRERLDVSRPAPRGPRRTRSTGSASPPTS